MYGVDSDMWGCRCGEEQDERRGMEVQTGMGRGYLPMFWCPRRLSVHFRECLLLAASACDVIFVELPPMNLRVVALV